VIGVEQWAEIRRLYFVERRSKRAIHRLTGVHRDTITRALAAEAPPRYTRPPAGSKLDPFKEWICEQLKAEPTLRSQRLRELASELGYSGGKSIFDEYVREVRPRFLVRRTFQRTLYRPGELVQCDLWEPREPIRWLGHPRCGRPAGQGHARALAPLTNVPASTRDPLPALAERARRISSARREWRGTRE
jgi:transposase